MKHSFPKAAATALAVALPAALPAHADPTLGIGLSFVFGGHTSAEMGLGLRLFTDDAPNSVVGSLGVDYLFKTNRMRPTAGVAYLGTDAFLGADLGFDPNGGGIDFGVSVGGTSTRNLAAPLGGGGTGGSGNDTTGGGCGNECLMPPA